MTSPTPEQAIAEGDPQRALDLLQARVRERSADASQRVFLFQLLCVLGQWQRAMQQLELCGELDAATLPMVNTYREALRCEAVREAVFQGKTTPMVFGQPQPWAAMLVEALHADARGDGALAARLRSDALAAAPANAGALDGVEFDWIADADSRLGPVLEAVINGRYAWVPFGAVAKATIEAPTDLRDLVWAPAHLWFVNGGDAVALVPTRYAGTAGEGDASLRMARKTEWIEIAAEQFRGVGQRILTTSAAEVGLLEVREVVLRPSTASE